MKITNVSTVYVRFYADNLPHYTNKKFSFSVKGFDSVEWTDNAKKVIYHFINHGNKIRRAFLVINGTSTDLYDTVKVINGKVIYGFTPK